jgi:hypothetical protein
MIVATLQNPAQKLVVKEAFAWSMRNMWILFSSAAVCGILATTFISKQALGREHTETKTGLKKEKTVEARSELQVYTPICHVKLPSVTGDTVNT